MSSIDKAVQTQLDNIQKKTGKSLGELAAIVKKSGLTKHGEIRDYLKRELGLGHGDANALVHAVLQSDGQHVAEGKSTADVLDEIYSGPKAHMRPIHEKLMEEINKLGEFETAPKKGYVSLRRRKQFVMIGPRTNTRFEVGINARDLQKNPRLLEQSKGSMCNYIVNLTDLREVDSQLIGWIKSAYESSG
jgi:predicted transport protein